MQNDVIYDIGANNGDDIPYYLLKGRKVVAIEANPFLCRQIETRFAREIKLGTLVVISCVVCTGETPGDVAFYIHKTNHVLSQLDQPTPEFEGDFQKTTLPAKNIVQIVRENGEPYYIKCDVEGYDARILKELFGAGIRPPFISAEAHSLDVFSLLCSQYNAFKLVDGRSVSEVYRDIEVRNESTGKLVRYCFPYHSAGPFGDDLQANWMNAENFLLLIATHGLGWCDIHATTTLEADPNNKMDPVVFLRHHVSRTWLAHYMLRAPLRMAQRGYKSLHLSASRLFKRYSEARSGRQETRQE